MMPIPKILRRTPQIPDDALEPEFATRHRISSLSHLLREGGNEPDHQESFQEESSDVDGSDHHVDKEDDEEALTPRLRKPENGRLGGSQVAPPKTPLASASRASRRSSMSTSKSYEEFDSRNPTKTCTKSIKKLCCG